VNDLCCAQFVEHVTALLEDALHDETEHEILKHLAACPGCRRYLDQTRQIIGALGSLVGGVASTIQHDHR
jgi:predicted anti-sigma-YlaC factor YlaD